MSDSTIDLREQLARIDRALEEGRKFSAERDKLIAEREKLSAEADKFRRERTLAPWLAGGAVAGGLFTLLNLLLKAAGVTP